MYYPVTEKEKLHNQMLSRQLDIQTDIMMFRKYVLRTAQWISTIFLLYC